MLQEKTLGKIQQTYKIFGFPINCTYTDLETIAMNVKITDIFECSQKGVQFAIATHVYPYVNNILSVWVYVAALTPENLI